MTIQQILYNIIPKKEEKHSGTDAAEPDAHRRFPKKIRLSELRLNCRAHAVTPDLYLLLISVRDLRSPDLTPFSVLFLYM